MTTKQLFSKTAENLYDDWHEIYTHTYNYNEQEISYNQLLDRLISELDYLLRNETIDELYNQNILGFNGYHELVDLLEKYLNTNITYNDFTNSIEIHLIIYRSLMNGFAEDRYYEF